MSFAYFNNLAPIQSNTLQFAALKMEADKAEQLRAQWKEIENKNVEKLTALLSNVEKIKQRTNSPVFKARFAVGDYINNAILGFPMFFVGGVLTGFIGGAAGYMISQGSLTTAVMPAIGGFVGTVVALSVGFSCQSTAEKYVESKKIAAHRELFEVLPRLASSTNSHLKSCMQQLYHLGADEKIPAPFWKQCLTLLRQIEMAANNFNAQQDHVKQQLEKMSARDPQADQALESLKSFAQRHQNFVEVKVEPREENTKEELGVQITHVLKI